MPNAFKGEPKGLYRGSYIYILDISYFYVSEYKRWGSSYLYFSGAVPRATDLG